MPTHDDLRAILEARFEADNAAPEDRPTLQRCFEDLVEAALQEATCTRNAFLEAVGARYQIYRRERYKAEKRRQP